MMKLPKGGNCPLGAEVATVRIAWTPDGGAVGALAMLVDSLGKLGGDGHVVHAGAGGGSGVVLDVVGSSGQANFAVDTGRLPSGTQSVVLYAFSRSGGLRGLGSLAVEVAGVASHEVAEEDRDAQVVAVCEFYLRSGAWKVRALSQAKPGDMDAVIRAAGGRISVLRDVEQGGAGASTGAPSPINLTKITLAKKGDAQKIDLTKGDKEIVINLNWNQKKKLFSFKGAIDLDLGCFLEMRDGGKMCIDGVQFARGRGGPRDRLTRQGCYTEAPWVWHMGDDRSGGQMATGENILVNPKGFSELRRMTVYAFIYEGAARWAETDAVVTVKVPGSPDVEVRMGEQVSRQMFCVIAELSFEGDRSVTVTKELSFHGHHGEADKACGWGMQWGPGGK